ncbi:MAG TPA: phage recombination protein Bet, partial [Dehalococcoidia bacterium]|nr:phage recombination protein Bet [Dehalococcoidia bacterium]
MREDVRALSTELARSLGQCSVAECSATVDTHNGGARGMCAKHYTRWKRHGDPAIKKERTYVSTPRDERWWSHVNQHGPLPEYAPQLGPCWLWEASTTAYGYGHFIDDGALDMKAHHFLVGRPPKDLEWDHLCRVHNCVRPSHLELVTHQENMRRHAEALRFIRGQASWLDEAPPVPEDADFVVLSRTRRGVAYPMLLTPEGIAVHQGEIDCEAERFNLACWHSEAGSTLKGQHEMTQALVKADAILTPAPIEFNDDQMAVIKNTIAKGASDAELMLFVTTCKRTGLDPFMRQIYAVKRYDSQTKGMVMAIQVGIDGQRLIAERTGKYDGQDPVEWLDDNGVWSEVWTGAGEWPVAARCSVYRKDWTAGRKATAVCRWDSYAQTFGPEHKLMPTWASMPDVMLGKCAESLALRRAFPAEMSAIAALAGQNYDPSLEDAGVEVAERPDALEGDYRTVETVPLDAGQKAQITKLWQGNLKDKDLLAKVRAAFPEVFTPTANYLNKLSFDDAVSVIAMMTPAPVEHGEEQTGPASGQGVDRGPPAASPSACDHRWAFNAETTLTTCTVEGCGATQIAPDDIPFGPEDPAPTDAEGAQGQQPALSV